MGLLGESWDDPRTAATLQLAAGLLSAPRLGQGLAGGLLGYNEAMQQAKKQKADEQMRALQMEQIQQHIAQQKAAAEQQQRQQDFIRNMPSPQFMAGQTALGGGGGPTQANAAAMPKVDPMQQMMVDGVRSGALPLSVLISSMQKDETPIVKPQDSDLVTKTGKVILAGKPKDDATPDIKNYRFGLQNPAFNEWDTSRKRAGATNVNVSMDKGFGDAFAKDAAASLATSRDAAKAAATSMQALNRIEKAIDAGAIVGPGSTFLTYGLQLGQLLGVGGKDSAETLANTRTAIQAAAQLNLEGATVLRGQGQVSNFEREAVEKAALGKLESMTPPEVKALVSGLRKTNSARIRSHADALKKVDPKFAPFTQFYEVPMPEDDSGQWSIRRK